MYFFLWTWVPDDSQNIAFIRPKVKFRPIGKGSFKRSGEPTRLFSGVCLSCILMSEWFADGAVDCLVSGNGTD
jgi:hypothetical protein